MLRALFSSFFTKNKLRLREPANEVERLNPTQPPLSTGRTHQPASLESRPSLRQSPNHRLIDEMLSSTSRRYVGRITFQAESRVLITSFGTIGDLTSDIYPSSRNRCSPLLESRTLCSGFHGQAGAALISCLPCCPISRS